MSNKFNTLAWEIQQLSNSGHHGSAVGQQLQDQITGMLGVTDPTAIYTVDSESADDPVVKPVYALLEFLQNTKGAVQGQDVTLDSQIVLIPVTVPMANGESMQFVALNDSGLTAYFWAGDLASFSMFLY